MRKLLKRLEAALGAIAFAEEGEVETARRLLAAEDPDGAVKGAPRARPERPAATRPDLPRSA